MSVRHTSWVLPDLPFRRPLGKAWSPARQWTENRHFLDESLRRGRIITTKPPGLARPPSAYWRDLVYLRRRGYPAAVQQTLSLL